MHDPPNPSALECAESAAIAKGIARCLSKSVPLQCNIFRATSQDFANQRDVLTGEGARRAGARYTSRWAFRAVYGSFEIETAIAEALGNSRDLGIPDAEALPLTFVGIKVDAQRVLDLTQGAVRHTLGISKSRLLRTWRIDAHAGREATTQAIGRLARAMDFQGIVFPSARVPGGRNLVLFPDRLGPGQMALFNKDKLPARRRRK